MPTLHGRRLSQDKIYGHLTANDIDITPKCTDASITIGAEGATAANVRRITIQLKDSVGNDIDYVEHVEIGTYTSSAMTAFGTTGPSTGLAAGTDGALQTILAKRRFIATSETDGDIDLLYTDTATGTNTLAIGVKLPTGRVVVSSAFVNA